MGDPKKHRKKYETPRHPWEGPRIEKEKEIQIKYGLKNKKEIWKADSKLRSYKRQAKSLVGRNDEQAKKELDLLIKKLFKLNLIKESAKVDDILGLTLDDILARRLQTQVYKKGLSRTLEQARQFIVHGHISLSNTKINVPSYIVKANDEDKISLNAKSKLSKPDHPETKKEEKTIGK